MDSLDYYSFKSESQSFSVSWQSISVTRRVRDTFEWVREMVLMMDKKEEESSSTDYDSDNVRNMVMSW